MCILFSYIAKRLNPGEFKLVILSNRDEFYHRASKTARFINSCNIYGTDETPGKEGGTWLGCSKLGKIGVLLNLDSVDYGEPDPRKCGRGFMVPDYLNSHLKCLNKYAESIKNEAENCNHFNLVLFQKNNDNWEVGIYENFTSKFNKLHSDFVSISNHLYEKPFPKTKVGEEMFKKIISQTNHKSKKDELVNRLFELAKYDAGKKFTELTNKSSEAVREMCHDQIYIDIPNYGTRTHTVILIDDEDQVTYVERNLKLPMDSSNIEWEDNIFEFSLKTEE